MLTLRQANAHNEEVSQLRAEIKRIKRECAKELANSLRNLNRYKKKNLLLQAQLL
jgi:hypothetical protein